MWSRKKQAWGAVVLTVVVSLTVIVVGMLLMNLDMVVLGEPQPHRHRMLLDTDVDIDDLLALFYLLKLNRSEFQLRAVTINTNMWTDAGHAVNHVYDILYMMGRDDIAVGVGGEGGILEDGTILPNVGGYLPLIEQGNSTAGYCRYRQAIRVGAEGRLDTNTNFGIRKHFLPQVESMMSLDTMRQGLAPPLIGKRRYSPFRQPTTQQVMMDVISEGPTTVLLIGSHTNLALFLMKNPHLKKNVKHIYIMGGSLRSGSGNVFTAKISNPYAEYNIFGDPFAAYQVIHSGIPVTLVPLDATETIPVTEQFLEVFGKNQRTYEARYCFRTLKAVRNAWLDGRFKNNFYMWDSFAVGIAASTMSKEHHPDGGNDFAEMVYKNITVVTSNEPYGEISDGSNPFFDGRLIPKFGLKKGGVHSGHVQTGLRDPFCSIRGKREGRCKDGYTEEKPGTADSVRILVAGKAKPNKDSSVPLDKEFSKSFLEALNDPNQRGRFNITTQLPGYNYKQAKHEPSSSDTGPEMQGKAVVFDMDMSAGDFLALFFLLKLPSRVLNLKGILITPTGWANAATVDVVYDLLHMMGRDDIPVGLGEFFAMNQTDPTAPSVGDCRYHQAIPHGSGGLLDSDTLFGLARNLPRSPRRYTVENYGSGCSNAAERSCESKPPTALDIWDEITKSLGPGNKKLTVLTSGPLTNLANILLSSDSRRFSSSLVQEVLIVGGHVGYNTPGDRGNVFSVPCNQFAEFNMFLDPLAADALLHSDVDITLVPLSVQRKFSSFPRILHELSARTNKTPELSFTRRLLSRLHRLQKQSRHRYQHMDMFLGEMVGAVILSQEDDDPSILKLVSRVSAVKVTATGNESTDGQMQIDEKEGKPVRIIERLNYAAGHRVFAEKLGDEKQSAVIGSFSAQKKMWKNA